MLILFPRLDCEKAVKKTKAEQNAKGFTLVGAVCRDAFRHLGRAYSLRDITGGLMSCEGKL
jgi:hypothetical protein